jgi:hypothetical protein
MKLRGEVHHGLRCSLLLLVRLRLNTANRAAPVKSRCRVEGSHRTAAGPSPAPLGCLGAPLRPARALAARATGRGARRECPRHSRRRSSPRSPARRTPACGRSWRGAGGRGGSRRQRGLARLTAAAKPRRAGGGGGAASAARPRLRRPPSPRAAKAGLGRGEVGRGGGGGQGVGGQGGGRAVAGRGPSPPWARPCGWGAHPRGSDVTGERRARTRTGLRSTSGPHPPPGAAARCAAQRDEAAAPPRRVRCAGALTPPARARSRPGTWSNKPRRPGGALGRGERAARVVTGPLPFLASFSPVTPPIGAAMPHPTASFPLLNARRATARDSRRCGPLRAGCAPSAASAALDRASGRPRRSPRGGRGGPDRAVGRATPCAGRSPNRGPHPDPRRSPAARSAPASATTVQQVASAPVSQTAPRRTPPAAMPLRPVPGAQPTPAFGAALRGSPEPLGATHDAELVRPGTRGPAWSRLKQGAHSLAAERRARRAAAVAAAPRRAPLASLPHAPHTRPATPPPPPEPPSLGRLQLRRLLIGGAGRVAGALHRA